MNIQTILLATTLAGIAGAGIAHADDTGPSQAEPYHYGMPLHVAKVVELTEPSTMECKVITAEMKYIDNSGQPAHISYRKLSEACSLQS
jgi:hypothetical protein